MRMLLLIPSVTHPFAEDAEAVCQDRKPRMDYHALRGALRARGIETDLLDYSDADHLIRRGTALARWTGSRDGALAFLGFQKRKQYDAIFTNGENIGIPLALLLGSDSGRPRHITIGHRLSSPKKLVFFRALRAHCQMDTIFLYARTQEEWARNRLGICPDTLQRIAFHADTRFFRPLPEVAVAPNQICSAGLEWRDYPTLIRAVENMPELQVRLAAASPWSRHVNETERFPLPPHVTARRYEYDELRTLYARSLFVVVPLYENDFQAGVTTILEAMAMGKAVVVTRTVGQRDVITDGENGLTVAPGDIEGWRRALSRLCQDSALRERLGTSARQWVEANATLERWVERIIWALCAPPP